MSTTTATPMTLPRCAGCGFRVRGAHTARTRATACAVCGAPFCAACSRDADRRADHYDKDAANFLARAERAFAIEPPFADVARRETDQSAAEHVERVLGLLAGRLARLKQPRRSVLYLLRLAAEDPERAGALINRVVGARFLRDEARGDETPPAIPPTRAPMMLDPAGGGITPFVPVADAEEEPRLRVLRGHLSLHYRGVVLDECEEMTEEDWERARRLLLEKQAEARKGGDA